MSEKHPVWTRRRVGRGRVHWVAYDDRPGAEDRTIIDQGYAASLVEADAAARSALTGAGMYQGRRSGGSFGPSAAGNRPEVKRPTRPAESAKTPPREYLYTRRHCDDGGTLIHAHLVVRKTAKKVYVTQQAYWWAALGTDEERWNPADRTIALDRSTLERDGSIYSGRHPMSDFYRSREQAMDESTRDERPAFGVLGLRPPCTIDDIKSAYRRRALEVHPDRGGGSADFLAVEDAYRQLLDAARNSASDRPPEGR